MMDGIETITMKPQQINNVAVFLYITSMFYKFSGI